MKIVLLANHVAIVPVIDYLYSQGWLQAVVSTDKLQLTNLPIEDFCKSRQISFIQVTRLQIQTTLKELFIALKPDVALMLGFSYRIPADIFNIPRLGFYNIHFSLLPAYRGADPVFWQIKNGEEMGGVTIHKVDENFDTGAVVMQQQVPFMPGETSGICNSRYGQVAYNMLLQLANKLSQGNQPPEITSKANTASYYPKPTAHDLIIQWDLQTAEQIESLINACNPAGGGAITGYRQQPIRILEVSPVDGLGDAETQPGTIVYANDSGIFVQCLDRQILRVNILSLNEGIITGFKLAALGAQKGDRFEHPALFTINK